MNRFMLFYSYKLEASRIFVFLISNNLLHLHDENLKTYFNPHHTAVNVPKQVTEKAPPSFDQMSHTVFEDESWLEPHWQCHSKK
eukprot:c18095_g1_i2 orf=281-532(+)